MTMQTATQTATQTTETETRKPSCHDVIVAWVAAMLRGRHSATIRSTDTEIDLRAFALQGFGKRHSPTTWGRRWREAKAPGGTLEQNGYLVRAVNTPGASQTSWVVSRKATPNVLSTN